MSSHVINHGITSMEDRLDRPISAPAVMTTSPSDGVVALSSSPSNASTASGVVAYVSNLRQTANGAAGNPRTSWSRTAARFSTEQLLSLSDASIGALAALAPPPLKTIGHHAVAADRCDDGHDMREEDGPVPSLTNEELRAEASRRYVVLSSTSSAAPLLSSSSSSSLSSRVVAPASDSTNAAMPFVIHGGNTSSSALRKAANRHLDVVDGTASLLMRHRLQKPPAHHEQGDATNADVKVSAVSVETDAAGLHWARMAAVVRLQRFVRRALACCRATRVVALLHVLRSEVTAPRMPMILYSKSSRVHPLPYTLEFAAEYEYRVLVENLAGRLVWEASADSEETKRSVASSNSRRAHQRTTRRVLTDAELSDVHDQLQERLAAADELAAADDAVLRKLTAAGNAQSASWWGALCQWLSPQGAEIIVSTFAALSHTGRIPADSFLLAVASEMSALLMTLDENRTATPTFSAHPADADCGVDRWESDAQRQKALKAVVRSHEQRLRDTVIDDSLIADTPVAWMATSSASAGLHPAGADEPQAPVAGPLRPMPRLLVEQPVPSAVSGKKDMTAEAAEAVLSALWRVEDPEARTYSKRLARRRVLGAEAPDDDSEDEGDRDGHSVTEHAHYDDDRAANELAAEVMRDVEDAEDANEFHSDRLQQLRQQRSQEALARSTARVSAGLLHTDISSSSQPKTSAPALTSSLRVEQWGLDTSFDSLKRAARLIAMMSNSDRSANSHLLLSTADTDDSDNHTSLVLPITLAGSRPLQQQSASACDALPTDCVICEIDAVDVHLCWCGNWLHRECAFDWNESASSPAPLDHDNGPEPLLKCCSLCGRK